jgi:hypothetical protein
MNAKAIRKHAIEDMSIGHCAVCAEDVCATFFNDGTLRVECAHSSICAKKRRRGAIDVHNSVGYEEEELVWLRAGWPDIDWTEQALHTLRLESAFDMAKLPPPPPFLKAW